MEGLRGVDWLAEVLDQKKGWVYDNYKSLGIPHVKVGKSVKFYPSRVARWVEDNSYDA